VNSSEKLTLILELYLTKIKVNITFNKAAGSVRITLQRIINGNNNSSEIKVLNFTALNPLLSLFIHMLECNKLH